METSTLPVKRMGTWLLAASFAVVFASTSSAAGVVPLVEAAKKGDAAAIQALLKQQPASVNVATADGTTALHWATDHNDLALTEVLVRAGANVKAANRYGVTPLYSAALNGNAAMLEVLLKAGASANAALPEGETPLMTASRVGNVDAVKVLLAYGAQVGAREGWKQQTALMWAAHEGNTATVKLLVEAGAKINDRSIFGWTPFLFAVRQGNIDTIEALLASGASITDTLPDGTSALVTAVQSSNFEAAEVLLAHGIDANASEQGWTALHNIAWIRRPNHGWRNPGQTPQGDESSLGLVKKLVEKYGADINARQTKEPTGDQEGRNNQNRFGSTAFSLAARNVDVPMMQLLLELGADPFLTTVEGTSPIMTAAGIGIYSQGENPGQPEEAGEAVKLLVDLGAPVDEVDSNLDTALHGPSWRGSNEATLVLVKAGAKLDAKNKYGWTPLTIAEGVYYNARIMMNKHTAKLLHELMVERGLETSQEGVNTNAAANQSGVVKGNAVIDDQANAVDTNEVKANLLELSQKREEALKRLQNEAK